MQLLIDILGDIYCNQVMCYLIGAVEPFTFGSLFLCGTCAVF